MHEPGTVCLVERTGDRGAEVDREFGPEPPLRVEQLPEALAVDELHHDGLATLVHEHVVDRDDVRVGQPGDGDRFAAEAFGDDGIGGEVGLQPLDRDLAIEIGVGRDPHLGHATLADAALQLISVGEQHVFGCL